MLHTLRKKSLFLVILTYFMVFGSNLVWASEQMPPLQWSVLQGKQSLSGDSLRIVIAIPKPWHITSHQPKSEFLIPLVMKAESKGVQFGAAVYPKPIIKAMPGLGFEGSYFSEQLIVKFPVQSLHGTASWSDVKISIDYQACTDAMCMPPTSEEKILTAASIAQTHKAPQLKGVQKVLASSEKEASSAVKTAQDSLPKVDSAKESAPAQVELAVAKSVAPADLAPTPPVKSGMMEWLKYLLLAFVGGLILNLMPCVLPVLGLKVFSLVQKQNHTRLGLIKHAGAFLVGTLLSFWLLALAMILLKKAGQQVGWGFQFQNVEFVLFMVFLVAVFALNLLGLFEVSLGWKTQTKLDGAARKDGLAGAFFNGAFMTLLATPCTAPMLSPAMGFAFSKPDSVLFLFMTFVAAGLALPYVVVCVFPQAIRFFPKPGAWMVQLKEFMGYLLLLTLVWLIYTFGQMAGNYALSIALVLIIFIPMMIWLWKILKWTQYGSPFWKKAIVLVIFGAAWFGYGVQHVLEPAIQDYKNQKAKQTQEMIDLQKGSVSGANTSYYRKPFDLELIHKLNREGKDVFVDFTADWCITCHVNEKVALSPLEVDTLFKQDKPVLLIGDYTNQDAKINQELKKFGRSGVPMYVLYKADGTAQVLPEVISKQVILDYIQH